MTKPLNQTRDELAEKYVREGDCEVPSRRSRARWGMSDCQCVACGSEATKRIAKIKNQKRPNGEPMEIWKCLECGAEWSE